MNLIDIIRALSSVVRSADSKSQEHQENSWECRELNPELLGGKQERFSSTLFLQSPQKSGPFY